MLRSRGKALLSVACLAAGGVIFWNAAWRVDEADHRSSAEYWQRGSLADCPVMAKTLHFFAFSRGEHASPLMKLTSAPGPCRWPDYGVKAKFVTLEEFKSVNPFSPDGTYIEHVTLSRPHYSLLHLRASVEVAHLYGPLGADGYVCTLSRTLRDWRVQQCKQAWIS